MVFFCNDPTALNTLGPGTRRRPRTRSKSHRTLWLRSLHDRRLPPPLFFLLLLFVRFWISYVCTKSWSCAYSYFVLMDSSDVRRPTVLWSNVVSFCFKPEHDPKLTRIRSRRYRSTGLCACFVGYYCRLRESACHYCSILFLRRNYAISLSILKRQFFRQTK